jgi:hypothetical protein
LFATTNDDERGHVFTTPKADMDFGPFERVACSEFSLIYGEGPLQQDIRGALAHYDPATGDLVPMRSC